MSRQCSSQAAIGKLSLQLTYGSRPDGPWQGAAAYVGRWSGVIVTTITSLNSPHNEIKLEPTSLRVCAPTPEPSRID